MLLSSDNAFGGDCGEVNTASPSSCPISSEAAGGWSLYISYTAAGSRREMRLVGYFTRSTSSTRATLEAEQARLQTQTVANRKTDSRKDN